MFTKLTTIFTAVSFSCILIAFGCSTQNEKKMNSEFFVTVLKANDARCSKYALFAMTLHTNL